MAKDASVLVCVNDAVSYTWGWISLEEWWDACLGQNPLVVDGYHRQLQAILFQ